jgi:nicotinamidase-related amidase
MAITSLDKNVALIVIDLQKGIVGMTTAHPVAGVIENACALAEAFRHHHLPVVLVNVTGGAPGRAEKTRNLSDLPADWADLIPELNQQPGDHLVTKRTWGAFTDTGLDAHLKALGVTQVVIAGVATTAGVESTARFAHEYGFNVLLAIDAMTDMSLEAHDNSVARIFPRLGETAATQAIIDLLGQGHGA